MQWLIICFFKCLARMVRGSTLAVREDVYVTAARALGASPLRIVLSHLLRNMVSPIVVQLTVVFAAVLVAYGRRCTPSPAAERREE